MAHLLNRLLTRPSWLIAAGLALAGVAGLLAPSPVVPVIVGLSLAVVGLGALLSIGEFAAYLNAHEGALERWGKSISAWAAPSHHRGRHAH